MSRQTQLARVLYRLTRHDFVRHGSLVFLASVVVNACNYCFHFAVSRALGVSHYGELSSIIAAMMIASVPSGIISTIVARYAAELSVLEEHAMLAALVWKSCKLFVAAGTIFLCMTMLFRESILAYFHYSSSNFVFIAVGLIALSFLTPIFRGCMQGMQCFTEFALATIIEGVGKLAIGIVLVGMGFGVAGALWGFLAGAVCSLIYAVWVIAHRLPARSKDIVLDIRRLCMTSVGVTLTSLGLTMLGSSDVILVRHYFDAYDSGIYGAVSLIGKIFLFAASFVPTILLPKATSLVAQGKSPLRILLAAFVLAASISIVGLSCVAALPNLIIDLLPGAAFRAGAPWLLEYSLAMVLLGVSTLGTTYKIGLHRYGFVGPLIVVAVLELIAIAQWHASVGQVIHVVLVSQIIVLFFVAFGITSMKVKSADPSEPLAYSSSPSLS